MAFTRLWMEVARTGNGYEEFLKRRQAIIASGRPGLLSYESANFTSLEQMRWVWKHILAFQPVAGVEASDVPSPGRMGRSRSADRRSQGGQRHAGGLSKGGNRDVTVKIFPHAGHSLMETPSRKGMAPGVFDYLRQWLVARVRLSHVSVKE